jgi:adenosylhomocysteine nucleosidase
MIGFVVPMEKEAWKLIERLENRRDEYFKRRRLYSGFLGDVEAKIMISGCGKVQSASSTQLLIDHFKCASIIHFGSAGAVSSELRIGDVVIGDEVVEYDYYQKFGQIDPMPVSYSDRTLAEKFGEWARERGVRSVRGRILSGNEDVVTTLRRDQLLSLHGGISVDWESGACALVCNLMSVPVLVLRGIVDYAYEGTHHEFSENLGDVSGKLGELIAEFITEQGQPRIDPVSDAIAYGIDVSLLDVNLGHSPQARIEHHESALELVNEMRRAGERLYKA